MKTMTPEEFATQLARLRDVYGDRHYPNERKEQLWERFKQYPAQVFANIVSRCIVESFVPPSATKMAEIGYADIHAWRDELREKKAARNDAIVRHQNSRRECPWPAPLEAVMIGASRLMANDPAQTESAYAFGCRFCAMTPEEGWKLYDLYAAKKFADPFAREILRRKNWQDCLGDLIGGFEPARQDSSSQPETARHSTIDPDPDPTPEEWENPF